MGVFLQAESRRIAGVVPLVPWETEDGAFDPSVFLQQLEGSMLGDTLRVGEELDGISGATLTVGAMLKQLRGLRLSLGG